MCYAIPGKVILVDGKFVTVDYFGEKKRAKNEFKRVAVGDYIYAQGGYVIEKVAEKDALEVLDGWKDVFFSLQKLDEKKAKINPAISNQKSKVTAIFNKVSQAKQVTDEEALYLLGLKDPDEITQFYSYANFLRQKYHKNSCCVHGIIEISNSCSENCAYCGISLHNKGLKRYRMAKDEILKAVGQAVNKYGFKALVLQSAEDNKYGIDFFYNAIKEIKEKFNVLIFISFGEISKSGLKRLYDAGARGILMRFETSNSKLYSHLHPGHKLEDRLSELEFANELGYLIVTGALIGLPGQTNNDILNDIKLGIKLNTEMYSFGPFVPHPETPLSGCKKNDEELVLKVLALIRFMARPDSKILVTTGFETISKNAREKGLMAGANSVMLNVTPMKYRALYNIYPNRAHEGETIENQIDGTVSLLKSLGRAPTDLSV